MSKVRARLKAPGSVWWLVGVFVGLVLVGLGAFLSDLLKREFLVILPGVAYGLVGLGGWLLSRPRTLGWRVAIVAGMLIVSVGGTITQRTLDERSQHLLVEDVTIRLGGGFRQIWTHRHSADYRGPVWIRIVPQPENRQMPHAFLIEWGPLERRGRVAFDDCDAVWLVHTKGYDPVAVPLTFAMNPLAAVSFGEGRAPTRPNCVQDINAGWVPAGSSR